jgi:putative inorganic carbon (HCO3(-)) transporter
MLPRGLFFQWSTTVSPLRGVAAGPPVPGIALAAGAAVLLFAGLALGVARMDAQMPLGAALALGLGLVPLLLWPQLATIVVVLLLYTNVPVLATQHGVPFVVASSFLALLGIPLLRHVLVHREPLRVDSPLLLMAVLLVVMLVSALGAKGPEAATDYVVTYVLEGIVLYWLVTNAIRSRASLRQVIWTLLAAGALLGALATYQEVTGDFEQQFGGLAQRNSEYQQLLQLDLDDPATLELLESFEGGRNSRAEGPVNEANRFAQILLVLLPLALYTFRTAQGRAQRLGAIGAGLLIFAGMAVSGSRAAFSVLVVIALLASQVGWIRRSHLLLGALVVGLVIPVVAPKYGQRIVSIGNVTALVEDEPTATVTADGAMRGRVTEMLAAVQAFLDHPSLGVGPGQYFRFYSLEYQQKDPRLKFRDLQVARRAHSLYAEMAAELGAIGLAVFLSIFGVLLRGLERARRRWGGSRTEQGDLATAFIFSLLAYLGTSVFLHLSYQRYLWFLLALAGVALHLLTSSARAERGAVA